MTAVPLTPASILPDDDAILVGRVWLPGPRGGEPLVVSVAKGRVYDLTNRFATVSEMLNAPLPAVSARPRRSVDVDLGSVADFLPLRRVLRCQQTSLTFSLHVICSLSRRRASPSL